MGGNPGKNPYKLKEKEHKHHTHVTGKPGVETPGCPLVQVPLPWFVRGGVVLFYWGKTLLKSAEEEPEATAAVWIHMPNTCTCIAIWQTLI